MTLWIVFPFLALAAIIQVAVLRHVSILGVKPDLPLIIVVAWGLLAPLGQAAQWGFILGILLDLASGLPFGIHTLTLTLIGLLIGLGQRTFFHGNVIAPPVAIILATILNHVLILATLALFNRQIAWGDYLLRITLPAILLNTVVAPLVYVPLQFLQRRSAPRPQIDLA